LKIKVAESRKGLGNTGGCPAFRLCCATRLDTGTETGRILQILKNVRNENEVFHSKYRVPRQSEHTYLLTQLLLTA
jgi:hypothetical protein